MANSSDFTLFFDDGGVLNDNEKRGPKWRNLIVQWFVPRYGGEPQNWEDANVKALDMEMAAYREMAEQRTIVNVEEFYNEHDHKWLETMSTHVGVDIPLEAREEAQRWIIPQAHAAYDGIIDVVSQLGNRFGPLYIASNGKSSFMDLYLTGMGIREHFQTLYGPDLINRFKTHVSYFTRMFDDIGLEPSRAIIIEDTPMVIKLIEEVGAIPIQSRFSPDKEPMTQYVVNHASELPGLIEKITKRL